MAKRKYYTRGQQARELLRLWGAPETVHNRIALQAWAQAEGNRDDTGEPGAAAAGGKFNMLNTTEEMPGATNYNSSGVKNYTSFEQGCVAQGKTLNYGADRGIRGYDKIRHRLRTNAPAWSTLKAVEESDWGTGGLGLKVKVYVALALVFYEHRRINQ